VESFRNSQLKGIVTGKTVVNLPAAMDKLHQDKLHRPALNGKDFTERSDEARVRRAAWGTMRDQCADRPAELSCRPAGLWSAYRLQESSG